MDPSTKLVFDSPLLRVHHDGRVERFYGTETTLPGFDAVTRVSSKDVVVDGATGVFARLYIPDHLLTAEHKKVPILVYLVFGCRYMDVVCRRRAVVEVLWPMDRAVDGGEGQPGPELGPGGSCGVHSWIEGASTDGRWVSWFAPQNQAGGRRLKTPSRGGTGVGLGTGGGTGV